MREAVDRRVRALSPSPGAVTRFRADVLRIVRGEAFPGPTGEPGSILESDPAVPAVFVATGAGVYRVLEVAPAGRKRMPAADWARGARFLPGSVSDERLGRCTVRQTARSVALEAIRRVTDEGAYSTVVIPGALRRSRLDERDRAFATDLAFGTIRHLTSIDWALDRVASRPVARMTPSARTVLRLGAYQVLFTGVAAHAAVGETVGLARDRERGFVNAVLRRAGGRSAVLARRPGRGRRRRVRTGMSPWAVRELGRLLPAEEVEPAAAAFAAPAALCLRANTSAIGPERFREALLEARPASLERRRSIPTCFLLDGGDPSRVARLRARGGSPCRTRRRRSSFGRSIRSPGDTRARRLRCAGRQDRVRGVARRGARPDRRRRRCIPAERARSLEGPPG